MHFSPNRVYEAMKKWWLALINVGIDENTSLFDRKRVHLINGIGFISSIFYVINFFRYIYAPSMVYECIAAVICNLTPILINYKKKYGLACHFYCIFNIAWYFFLGVTAGAIDYSDYIYIPSSVAAMIFFREFRTSVIYFVLNLFSFGLVRYSHTIIQPVFKFKGQEDLAFSDLFTVFLMVFLIVVYFRFENSNQEKSLEERNKIVEEKNKDILDSINYAKRIQTALLKEEERVSMHLPDHFILFKPKDIVSGDFYWALEKEGHLYIAAVDCTGHGVPGGFMSMLGVAFLNEITADARLLTPAEILDRLRSKILKELGQTGEANESKDGMDISLLRMNLETKETQWSGANNPLWYLMKGEMKEITADKQPIGHFPVMKPFTNHNIVTEKDSILYLFSDGYADQFGGSKGKKFKYKQLQEKLLTIRHEPLAEQKRVLDETLRNWKGNLEQVDDILIIGIKV
jgi:serine phosphatase RsbU (regulator of sigma subunit)